MEEVVSRYKTFTDFIESNDACWDITDESVDATALVELLPSYPDILYIYNGNKLYLLNREYIGKPKILQNGDKDAAESESE